MNAYTFRSLSGYGTAQHNAFEALGLLLRQFYFLLKNKKEKKNFIKYSVI